MGIQTEITDLAELKRLSDWARSCVWAVEVEDARLGKIAREFMAAATPDVVLALIAENERIAQFEVAYKEWSDKTEWVQESCHWSELGMHRADVMRGRANKLKAENEELRKDAERYRWFRDHSIQIVHTSTISWAFHLDKLIDDAMSPGYYAIRNQPDEV